MGNRFSIKNKKNREKNIYNEHNRYNEYEKLNAVDIANVSKVPNQNKKTLAKIIKVYDGDTCTCLFMHDNQVPMILSMRIKGIDAPELRTKNDMEKEAAILVRDHVSDIIYNKIVPIKLEKWDKFGGRVLGDVYIDNDGEVTLSNYLLGEGIVKVYEGKKKEEWTNNELRFIINKLKR